MGRDPDGVPWALRVPGWDPGGQACDPGAPLMEGRRLELSGTPLPKNGIETPGTRPPGHRAQSALGPPGPHGHH